MSKNIPLIVILGASACGKSKLALELASRFSAEIISADSMQVYKGLDIATNKVSEEEQHQVKHHMMNLVEPDQSYSVVDFRNKALGIINNLMSEKVRKLPIIVGGTNYYIESLLWKDFTLSSDTDNNECNHQDPESKQSTLLNTEINLLQNQPKEALHVDEDFEDIDKFFAKPIYPTSFLTVESQKLWNLLEKVDPEAAHSYHYHDKRRIIRCLQIIQNKKRKYTDIVKTLNKSSDDNNTRLGGPLRFPNTCVFWIHCEEEKLDKILDERVDQMLERGLLTELEDFHKAYDRIRNRKEKGFTLGIFQTIGFKEFHDYLVLDDDTKKSEKGNKILEQCIKYMKISTRQYVRRQLKWIRSRFLRAGRDLPPLFKLTTSFSEDGWNDQVRRPAFDIVDSFVEGKPLGDDLLSLKPELFQQEAFKPAKLYCDVCERSFIGSVQIEEHLKSKNHERARYKKQKLGEFD